MRSTDRRRQRGVSLIEALIASALLGVAVVVGITAWDTATVGAKAATRKAWATCTGRSEMEAVLASPGAGYPSPLPYVTIQTAPVPNYPGLQQVTVSVNDPESKATLYNLSALKATQLDAGVSVSTSQITSIPAGCPSR